MQKNLNISYPDMSEIKNSQDLVSFLLQQALRNFSFDLPSLPLVPSLFPST